MSLSLWVLVNLGSKFWQSRWEQRLHETEEALAEDLNLFSASWKTVRSDVEKNLGLTYRKRGLVRRVYERGVLSKPSVTLMMTLLSGSFVVFWLTAAAIGIRRCFW